MRLHTLTIEGFRRIKNATILFGDATFLIGPNNVGKSSVLYALRRFYLQRNVWTDRLLLGIRC